MNKKAMILMVGGLIFSLTGACLAKMSAQQVINQMRGAYEQRMSGIDDLTMVTKGTAGIMAMMGETTVYKKASENFGKDCVQNTHRDAVYGQTPGNHIRWGI